MGKYNNLLSIIIPTKNRYECLIPVVSALLKYIENDDVELIIQDNSDDNKEGLLFFEQLKDQRVKYFYHQESLSIQDNTIFAIDNAKGKYLIFIGDDDLVSPYIYDIVKFIDKKNIECLVFNAAYYWWNTVDFEKENYFHRKNALWLPINQSLEIVERYTHNELEIMLQSGAGIFSRLPKFYHGIVRRDVLEKIKERTGTYLPGSSPDIAFSTALSLVLDKYYFINFPLSVFGASRNSGGGMTARKQHYGKIEDQKFLPKNIVENWNPLIPRIWSEKTIYAQTVTEVLKVFKSNKDFNYINFYGTMLAYEPYLLKVLVPVVKSYCGLSFYDYFKVVSAFVKKKLGMWYRKLKFFSKTYDYEVLLATDVDFVMKTLKDSKTDVSKLNTK
ncbi:glycosyltransferase family 2 protein [Flavobacterium sp. LS2P90]|uniref:Glycosyltransferase family 2 protein n=1 Tax=Flavobacterium xylosi TaxID=3230415 RepID=A0ABW6HZ47_9FLAO